MASTTFPPRFAGTVNDRVDAFTLEVTCRELAVLERIEFGKLTTDQKRQRVRLHMELVAALRRLS